MRVSAAVEFRVGTTSRTDASLINSGLFFHLQLEAPKSVCAKSSAHKSLEGRLLPVVGN